jgi:hypothetical protein
MGLVSPERIEQVKLNEPSQLPSEIRDFLELGNHHKTNRMAKTIASQLPLRPKKAKPSALYKLSKIYINFSYGNIRHGIFRYEVS